jgi:hypothetical protein
VLAGFESGQFWTDSLAVGRHDTHSIADQEQAAKNEILALARELGQVCE